MRYCIRDVSEGLRAVTDAPVIQTLFVDEPLMSQSDFTSQL